MALCLCSLTLGNTGTPSKQTIAAVTKKVVFVPLYADDGTRNSVASTDTLNLAYFTALVNNADASKRWYPTPEIKNITDERADPTVETFTDNTTAIAAQGVRSFLGLANNMGGVFLSKLQAIKCNKVGVYFIDECGKLVGTVSADGLSLYPVAISDGSFDPRMVKTTDSTIAKVQLGFNVSSLEQDYNLRVVETEADADLLNLSVLLDVNAAISAPSTTGFVAALTLDYGPFGDAIKVKGWLLADFVLYNETSEAAIVITSVTEGPDGTYTFVIPAQTPADVLTLTSSKDGFELVAATITIP